MNIAIINQGGNRYLFEVPESISLKEGEKVKCDTKRGVTDGTVWADSVTTDEPTAKLIGKLLGAKFPLKSVVGKTVTSVEMFERPKQLYCGKVICTESNDDSFTVGRVYEFKDGLLDDNQGATRPHYLVSEKIKSLSDEYLKHWPYKFIEFKGE